MSDFLQKDYKIPETPSRYMRLSEGRNTFRVLGSAIVGWEYWVENEEEKGKRKPIRVKTVDEVPGEFMNAKNWRMKAKHFWAFPVYNRDLQDIQILEVTQKAVMKGVEALVNDGENWGDPRDYDICVTRSKTGSEDRDVEYSVLPMPKKKLDETITDTYEQMTIDLEALFSRGDPFAMSSERLADEVAEKV